MDLTFTRQRLPLILPSLYRVQRLLASEEWQRQRKAVRATLDDSLFYESESSDSEPSDASTCDSDSDTDASSLHGIGLPNFNLSELYRVLYHIAKRMSTERLVTVLRAANVCFDENNIFWLTKHTLKTCPKSATNECHQFHKLRGACISCSAQLCSDCEMCILDVCKFVPRREHQAPDNEWKLRDSLATKRISSPCVKHSKPEEAFSPPTCKCLSFMSQRMSDSTRNKFSLCPCCFQKTVDALQSSNTKTVTVYNTDRTTDELQEYTCDCGAKPDYTRRFTCRICNGCVWPFTLNEGNSQDRRADNNRRKVYTGTWDNEVCEYFVPLILGL